MSLGQWDKDIEENEELEMYKERLQEIEIAFRYNLNLLSDRDAELDMLEDQLRSGVVQLEELSREKREVEVALKSANKEIRNLRSKMVAKDRTIEDLERKNEGNLKTLKKTLDDLRQEQRQDRAKFEMQRMELERNFVRVIQLKEAKLSEEMNELNRKCMQQLDEITRGRLRLDTLQSENRNLRRQCSRMKKDSEEKEQTYLKQIRELDQMYGRVTAELEGIIDHGEARAEVADAATQTSDEDQVDREKFNLLQEQNSVLRSIVKNLKRSKEACKECAATKAEETTRKFQDEINELKRALDAERSQRLEEESIIKNLEASVVCLKERLMAGLRRSQDDAPRVCGWDEAGGAHPRF